MKRFSGIVGGQTVAVVGVVLWEVRTMMFATGNYLWSDNTEDAVNT